MGAVRSFFVILAIGLAGCSTNIERHGAVPAVVSNGVNVTAMETTLQSPKFPPAIAGQLEAALRQELAKHRSGPTPVTLKILVTEFDVRSEGERVGGVFVGDNAMNVHVDVLDAQGNVVDSFEVKRSSNPGGYGMFYDQKAATIKATAEGIADALY